MTDAELLEAFGRIHDMLVAVATGGPRIAEVNPAYQQLHVEVDAALRDRGFDTLPFPDLWDWYGRWSSGDLQTYQSRRAFVADLLRPVIEQIRTGSRAKPEPTGWERVDRTVGETRESLAAAENEEQFQAVGLLCRDTLVSLAQAVYVRERYPPLEGKEPSPTDAKRMLEAYIAVELAGGTNDEARKHAKSALDLANALQHRRTAAFREAALCVEATTSVVNIIAIVAGRRDPL